MTVESMDTMADVERGLRSLYDGPVTFDLSAVTEGAMRRAVRRRRRRTAVTLGGAAMAVGALAITLVDVTHADSGPVATPASSGQAQLKRVARPLYGMPDVAPTGSELVGGVSFSSDLGDSGGAAPAMGVQSCQVPGRTGRPEVASRSWSFVENGNDLTGNEADLTLTGWAAGTGPAAMAELVADKGTCAFEHPQTPLPWPGHAAPDHWLAVSGRTGDTRQVVAATRVGDVLVTVVSRSRSEATAVQMSTRMADTAVARLRASGLPAAEGKACRAATPCPPATAKWRTAGPAPTGPSVNAYQLPDVRPSDPAVLEVLPAQGPLGEIAEPLVPAVMGAQTCQDGRRTGQREVAGRSWAWGDLPDATTGRAATLTVTGWPKGSGAAVMAGLQGNTGVCQWSHPQQRESWSGHADADHWLSTWTDRAATQRVTAVAVVRVGDVLVGAAAVSDDRAQALELARSMAGHAEQTVRASGLPAVHGR